MDTYDEFFSEVMMAVTGKVYQGGLDAFYAVSTFEGLQGKLNTGPQRYNPLNSVVVHGDSTRYNSVGVQDYKSFSNGIQGSVALLRGSPWNGVVHALRDLENTDAVLEQFADVYRWVRGITYRSFPRNDSLGRYVMTAHGPVKGAKPTPPVTPPVTPPSTEGLLATIHLRSGETLWSLAVHYYKDGEKYKVIQSYNHILHPDSLPLGSTIKIPRL